MSQDLKTLASAIDIMEKRRRCDDATACVVIERTDVWLWVVCAFVAGLAFGTALGVVLGAVFRWWFR